MAGWLGSYETVKYVNIQDARLGALRLILLIGIVSYVVIVEMLQLGGYLESNPIVGTVRFSLQQPTKDNCDPTKSSAENYDDGDDNNNDNRCTNAFAPLNELEYCQQSKTKTNDRNYTAAAATTTTTTTTTTTSSNNNYAGNVYPCEIYEAVNAQVLRETSLVIWTRATTYNQTLVCDGSMESGEMVCPRTYENNANDDENNNLYTAASDTTSTTTTNQQPQPTPFYIAQSEAFTVLLEHAATASKICEYHNHHQHGRRKTKKNNHKQQQQQHHYACSAQAEEHPGGRLYSTNQQLCQKESLKNNSFVMPTGSKLYSSLSSSTITNGDETAAGCYIGANQTTSKKQDFFSLDVLLQAAGISLDDCIPSSFDIDNNHSDKNKHNHSNKTTCTTYRESGATLLLSIVWNDFQPFYGLVEPFYYYSPSLIGTSSYKESIPFYYNTYRSSRILLRGHGIKIAVLMTGNFHQFQALRFLITLTTALGMLAVATTVVDSLMLYVLPEKERYQRVKYEQVRVGQVVVGVGDGDGAVATAAEEEDGESQQQLLPSEMTASEERSSSPGWWWWWWWLWPMRDQQPVSPNSQHVMETSNRDTTTVATTTRPNDPLPAAAVTTAGQQLDGDTTRDSTSSGNYPEAEENVLDIVGDHNHNNINNDAPPPQPQSSENNDLTEPLLPLVERRQAMLNRHPSS